MNWRPKGWVTIDRCLWMPDGHHVNQLTAVGLYESGADAMLKALRGQGRHFISGEVINEPYYMGMHWENVPGTLCFIPDDVTETPTVSKKEVREKSLNVVIGS